MPRFAGHRAQQLLRNRYNQIAMHALAHKRCMSPGGAGPYNPSVCDRPQRGRRLLNSSCLFWQAPPAMTAMAHYSAARVPA